MAKRVDQLFQGLNFNEPFFRTPTPASAGHPYVITVKKTQFSVKTPTVLKEPHVKTTPKIFREMKSAATKAVSATKGIHTEKSKPGSKAKVVTGDISITKKKSANKVKSNPKFKSASKTPMPPNLLPGVKKSMSPYIAQSAVKVESTTKSATKVKSTSKMNSTSKKKSVKKTKLITKVKSATKAVTNIQPQYVNKSPQNIVTTMADIKSQSKAATESFIKSSSATKSKTKSTLTVAKQPVTNMVLSVDKRYLVTKPQNISNLIRSPTTQETQLFQTLSDLNTLSKQQTTKKSSTTTNQQAHIFPKSQDFAKLETANKFQRPSLFTSVTKSKVIAKDPSVITNPQISVISQNFHKALLEIESPMAYPRSVLSKTLSKYSLPTLTQPQSIANALNITKMLTSTTPSIVVNSMNVTVPQSQTENNSKNQPLMKLQLPSKNLSGSAAKITQIFPAVKQAHTATKLPTNANSQNKYSNQFDTKLKFGPMQSAPKPQTILNAKASSRPQTRFRTQTPAERLQATPTLDNTMSSVQDNRQTNTSSNTKPLAVVLSTGDKMAATTALLGTKSLASWQIDSKTNQRKRSIHRTVVKTKTKMSCSSPHLRNQTTTDLKRELPIPVCTPSVLRPSKADIHGRNRQTKLAPQINNPTYKKMCNDFDAPEKRVLVRAVKLLESQTRPTPMAAKSLSRLKATAGDSRYSARLKPAAQLTTFSGLKIRK